MSKASSSNTSKSSAASAIVDNALRSLDEEWRTTGDADISKHLPPTDDKLYERVMAALIPVDQEYRWKNGNKKVLEEYLAEWPLISNRKEVVIRLLEAECLTRIMLGHTISKKEIATRFPQLYKHVDFDQIVAEAQSEYWESIDLARDALQSSNHVGDCSDADDPMLLDTVQLVPCPYCRQMISVSDTENSHDIECPRCGHVLQIVWKAEADEIDTRAHVQFDGFELLEGPFCGAFGTVWKVRDLRLDCVRAVKIPHRDRLSARERTRFVVEAQSAAQLRHPNIVAVHGVAQDRDDIYIVSDFIDGATLDKWWPSSKKTHYEAAQLCLKIAQALQHAHEHDIIHRDLKPANIIVDDQGEPHVADFGLAKRLSAETSISREGQILGSPAYMSPEQAAGQSREADGRADVYSLGVILFQLLTGRRPFQGSADNVIEQKLTHESPKSRELFKGIPRDLDAICTKCLQKSPHNRYSSAGALAADLERYLKQEPVSVRPLGRIRRFSLWCRRRPAVAGLSFAFLFSIVAGSILIAVQSHRYAQDTAERMDRARRANYNSTLTFVQNLWRDDWQRAREILNDPERMPPELRDFNWRMLAHASNREPIRLSGFGSPVLAMEFSPEEDTAFAIDRRGELRKWTIRTNSGSIVKTGAVKSKYTCAVFSENAATVAVSNFQPMTYAEDYSSNQYAIEVWDTCSGQRKESLPLKDRHDLQRLSDDGRTIITTQGGRDTNDYWEWDLHTGTKRQVENDEQWRRDPAFTTVSDNNSTFSSSFSGTSSDIRTCYKPAIFDDAFDGATSLRLFRFATKLRFKNLEARVLENPARQCRLIVADTSRSDYIVLHEFHAAHQQIHLKFSSNGRYLAMWLTGDREIIEDPEKSGNWKILIWDVRHGSDVQVADVFTCPPDCLGVLANGDVLLASSQLPFGVWTIGDACARQFLASRYLQRYSGSIVDFCVSPDGAHLAIGDNNLPVRHDRQSLEHPFGRVTLWETASQTCLTENSAAGKEVQSIGFSPDGTTLAWVVTAPPDGRRRSQAAISVMDVSTRSLSVFDIVPPVRPLCLGFVRNNVLCLVANCDRGTAAFFLDPNTIRPEPSRIHTTAAKTAVHGPVSLTNATSSIGCISLTGNRVAVSTDGNKLLVFCCDLRDGRDQLSRLWQVNTRTTAMSFSPDGETLVTGAEDGSIQTWDAMLGQERLRFWNHTTAVDKIRFSHNTCFLSTLHKDGKVFLCGMDEEVLQRQSVCKSVAVPSLPITYENGANWTPIASDEGVRLEPPGIVARSLEKHETTPTWSVPHDPADEIPTLPSDFTMPEASK